MTDLDRNLEIKRKSEEEFEKNIVYITAGTLALSLTFIDKIVNLRVATHTGLLVTAWIILTVTLLANLMSHLLGARYALKTFEDKRDERPNLEANLQQRTRVMMFINWATVVGLISGLAVLISFCSINAYGTATSGVKKDGKLTPPQKDSIIVRIVDDRERRITEPGPAQRDATQK